MTASSSSRSTSTNSSGVATEAFDQGSIEVRAAGRKGLGVFACRYFAEGSLILRFSGRRVGRADLPELTEWEREHLGEIDIGLYQVLPEPRCYVNHACSPNAVSTRDTLYAVREIRASEEISIDYRLNAYDDGDVWEMSCDCGAPDRPHTVVGDFFSMSAEQQARNVGVAPPFIQRLYRQRRGLD